MRGDGSTGPDSRLGADGPAGLPVFEFPIRLISTARIVSGIDALLRLRLRSTPAGGSGGFRLTAFATYSGAVNATDSSIFAAVLCAAMSSTGPASRLGLADPCGASSWVRDPLISTAQIVSGIDVLLRLRGAHRLWDST